MNARVGIPSILTLLYPVQQPGVQNCFHPTRSSFSQNLFYVLHGALWGKGNVSWHSAERAGISAAYQDCITPRRNKMWFNKTTRCLRRFCSERKHGRCFIRSASLAAVDIKLRVCQHTGQNQFGTLQQDDIDIMWRDIRGIRESLFSTQKYTHSASKTYRKCWISSVISLSHTFFINPIYFESARRRICKPSNLL